MTISNEKKTHGAITGKGSTLAKYQDVIVGNRSLLFLFYYEWCTILGVVPGALGMLLRKIFWPRLFGSCGKKVAFARGIVIRHPKRIHFGNAVVISEGCVLDGRQHQDSAKAIVLGNNVILSNNVTLSCKNGYISIGDATGINTGSIVQSTNQCPVVIGDDVIIGQMSLVVGGGNYNTDQLDILIREQGIVKGSGVTIEDNVWVGANVTVLDGVTVAKGSILAAGSVVTKSMPAYSVSCGVPAAVVKNRQDATNEAEY